MENPWGKWKSSFNLYYVQSEGVAPNRGSTMTKKNGYTKWTDHPEFKELCRLSDKSERLKRKAMELRAKISKDVYGDIKLKE